MEPRTTHLPTLLRACMRVVCQNGQLI